MPIYYDVATLSKVHFTIEFTNNKIPETIFLRLLEHVQTLGLGPKGRGHLKILKVMKTKG